MLKLSCKVQNYAWGRPASDSLVAKIAGQESDHTKPYAEYWMGDHVNGPSFVYIDYTDKQLVEMIGSEEFCAKFDKQFVTVSELVKLEPTRFLGANYNESYPLAGDGLAFLFKVLSVQTALSIQAHPNRPTAEKLHI
jgi:mannose-6-phosphate isomerase